jgi:hypothetical protein
MHDPPLVHHNPPRQDMDFNLANGTPHCSPRADAALSVTSMTCVEDQELTSPETPTWKNQRSLRIVAYH